MATKSNFGGAQKYIFDIARSLVHNQEIDLSVIAGGNGSLFEKCRHVGIRTASIPHLERDMSLGKEMRSFFALVKILRKEKPHVVHLNSPKMGGLGALAARLAGVKHIIYTNHGWTFHEERPLWQKILIKVFSWIIILLSTRTIVLSEKEYNDVRHWPFTRKKLSIIPLGIASPAFLEKNEARKNLFEMAGANDIGQELILSIGELTKNKGYGYALEALSTYTKPYSYFIIGTGELEHELKDKIHTYGITDRIHLLGYVDNAAQYMKAADIFLLPSIKEGLPYVLLEAGYAEIPVIATRVGGIEEMTEGGKTNLVEPKDAPALLISLIDKKVFYSKKYSLETMVKKTLELYPQD